MALFVQTPRNETILSTVGSYRRRLNVLSGKGTNVQRRLRRGGLANYEPSLQSTLLALVEGSRKQLVFYDVGAHIGLFSALVSIVFRRTGIQVLAFEPTPSTFSRAVRFRDKNGLRYMLFQLALSDRAGEAVLFLSTKAETSNSLNAAFRPGSTPVAIVCQTLDEIVAGGAPPPVLIKIDVESFEPQVLLGARQTIAGYRPWITCELLAETDEARLGQALDLLMASNYRFYQIERKFPWRERSKSEVIQSRSSSPGSRDWLVAPKALSTEFYRRFSRWHLAIQSCSVSANCEGETREKRKGLLEEMWSPPVSAKSREPIPDRDAMTSEQDGDTE
jgi:FkbM family methyltransferase